jgi:hypothetical protein
MLLKVQEFLEREAGHLAVLSAFTGAGVLLYCLTRDKFLVEFFGAALLLAMRGGVGKAS